jgi:hypothetical protein
MGPNPKNNFVGGEQFEVRDVPNQRRPDGVNFGPHAAPAFALSAPKQTPWTVREIRRRRRILAEFDLLIAGGTSQLAAAKSLRQSPVTLWRWRQRLEPNVFRCGRKPAFSKSDVPARVFSQVERLQLAGMGNERAWRMVAAEKICPPTLAKFLRSAWCIPADFLRSTRLVKKMVKVVQGTGFTVMQKT